MAEKIAKLMNDSPLARWTVLVLVALMMFFAYMFVDVMSPLKSLVESDLGWNSSVFGKYAASEYILNVCGFLIIAGYRFREKLSLILKKTSNYFRIIFLHTKNLLVHLHAVHYLVMKPNYITWHRLSI